MLHLGIAALDKHIGNPEIIQFLIQVHISAENLAFTGFNNQSVHILRQNIFQTLGFFLPAVTCIFQDVTSVSGWDRGSLML